MKRVIRKVVGLISFLYTCSAVVLHSPVLEDSTFQNETAIQVNWQFENDQPVSNFIVMATGKFFDNKTRKVTTEDTVRSVLLTDLKSGETYIITVVVVNGTQNSTSRELEVNTMVFAAEIEVLSSSFSTLSFRWSLPVGERAKSFQTLLNVEGTLYFQEMQHEGDTFDVTYYNLSASSNYVILVTNTGYNGQFEFTYTTYSTDIPSILTDFISNYNTEFSISWWGEDNLYLSGPFLVEYYGQNIDTEQRNKTVESSYRKADITGLISGETYMVTVSMSTRIATKTSNVSSITTKLYTPVFNYASQTTTTLTLTWTSTNGFVEYFKLTYGGVELETSERVLNVAGSELQAIISGLIPGVEYKIEIVAVSNSEISQTDSLRIATMPGPVENLQLDFTSSGHLLVNWSPPSFGYVERYEIEIHNSTSLVLKDEAYSSSYQLLDPIPEEMYTVYVTALAKDGERGDTESSHTGLTTSVSDTSHDVNETTIRLTWTSPTDTYTLVRVTCDSCIENNVQDFYIDDDSVCLFTDLSPGSTHFISFETFLNGESISQKILLLISTAPDAPTVSPSEMGSDFIVLSLTDATCSNCIYKGQATSELGNTLEPVIVEPVSSTQSEYQMRFEELQPGTRYTLSVVAEVNLVTSKAAKVEQQTNLGIATNFTWNTNTSSVSLSWAPPSGLYDTLMITCLRCGISYTSASDDAPMAIFGGLSPGTSYFFIIETTRSGFKNSLQQIIHVYTAPKAPDSIKIFDVNSTSITIEVTDNDCTGCDYHITAMSDKAQNQTITHDRLASETMFKVKFNDLIPGTNYVIQIIAVNAGIESSPANITETTNPKAVEGINFAQITPTGFSMYWDAPEGNSDGFLIIIEPSHTQVPLLDSLARFHVFTGLEPYTEYTLTVASLAGTKISPGTTAMVETLQGIPGPVRDLHVQPLDTSTIVRFSPPMEVYGVLRSYSINQIGEFPGLPRHSEHRLINVDEPPVIFDGLLLGYNYTYIVQALNEDNSGIASFSSVVIPQNEPEPSTVKPGLVPENAITSESFTVVINDLLFKEDNGPVSTFVVIVAELQAIGDSVGGETGEGKDGVLQSWGQVINMKPMPRYQTSDPIDYSIVRRAGNRKKREAGVNIDIGSDNCTSVSVATFCNGPLKPGKTYVYQFRGFYNTDYYADTLYSEPITLDDNNGTQTEDKDIVVIAVVLGLVILLLIGLMIILVYSYRTKNKVLRTIVGKDGTFREANRSHQDVNLVSMKLKPEERWDLNFAHFESSVMEEHKNSNNISLENIVDINNMDNTEANNELSEKKEIEETNVVIETEQSSTLEENMEVSNGHANTEDNFQSDNDTQDTSFIQPTENVTQ